MGSAHINSQESVVEKEEKQGGEYVLHQPDRGDAIETYREECETSKKSQKLCGVTGKCTNTT